MSGTEDKTLDVSVSIQPEIVASDVYFVSSDTSKVEVRPEQLSSSSGTLTINGIASGDSATIDARLGSKTGDVIKKLRVAAYPRIEWKIAIHDVDGTFPTDPPIEEGLWEILKQAVVEVELEYKHDCSTNEYDIAQDDAPDYANVYPNTVDLCENPTLWFGEAYNLAVASLGGHWIDGAQQVYYVNLIRVDRFPAEGTIVHDGASKWILISANSAYDHLEVLAHEIFHNWHRDESNEDGNLMNSGSSGTHLNYKQWEMVR